MPIDTSSVLQGLLQSYKPKSAYTFGAFGDEGDDQGGGIIPSQGQLTSPFELQQTQRAAAADAADRARIQAIRDTQLKAYQEGEVGATPQQQVGPLQPGESPSWTAYGKDPVQKMGESKQLMEMMKINAPIREQEAKSRGQLELEQKRADILKQMVGMSGAQTPSAAQTAPPPPSPGGPAEKPPESVSWMSFLTGKGAPPYSDLKSLLGAQSERLKYSVGMPTPWADIVQPTSFANLEQVQGMFPGVRGVQHLLEAFREHQAVVGREAPAGTYQRMGGMLGMLDEAESAMNDPSIRFKTGPSGQLELAVPPQAIQRAKLLLADTRNKLIKARSTMERLYPGVSGAVQQAVDPYSNPNYQPR